MSYSFAQVASDFTQTDLNGTTHNLYTYLNAGKVVIVDMSATWCGPCWDFHQAHYLQALHDQYGPNGTNEVVVIFYEDDVQTTLADLNGTGSNTLGNWVAGVTYPIINATVALPSEYGSGYPTISVICPTDKKIKDNLYNYNNLNAMKTAVQSVITACASNSNTNEIDEITALEFGISPNPVINTVSISFNKEISGEVKVLIYSANGQLVKESYSNVLSSSSMEVDLSNLEKGSYFISLVEGEQTSKMQSFVKL
jgi:thiol-disulfide isomerase/thioredoxin